MRRRLLYNIKSQGGEVETPTITYSVPDVSLSYPIADYNATSINPVFSYSLIETITYSDHTDTDTITDGADVTFTISNAVSGVSINATTGKLSFSKNTNTEQLTLCTVSVQVVMNGQTGNGSCTVYLSAAPEPEWLPAIVDAVQINNIPVSGTDGTDIGVSWYQDKRDGTISDRIFGDTGWATLGEDIDCQYQELENSGMYVKKDANSSRIWRIVCPPNIYYKETVVGKVSMMVTMNDVEGEWSDWYDVFQYSSTLEGSFDITYSLVNNSEETQEYPDIDIINQFSIPIPINEGYVLWVRVPSGTALLSDSSSTSNPSIAELQVKIIDVDDTFSENMLDVRTWELKPNETMDLATDWMSLTPENVSVWLQFAKRYAELQPHSEITATATVEWLLLKTGYTPNN